MSIRTLDITEATQPLADYAQDSSAGPIVVTVNGQPVAVVIGTENIDLETLSLTTNPQFLALIEKSRQRQKKEGGLSSQEMRQLLGLD